MRFVELEAVLAVARLSSFRAAATELGMSPTALGKTIAALEQRLAVRLFNRTTRSVAITAAGRALVDELAPALTAIHSALDHARSTRDELSGALRINSSLHGARSVLPHVTAFLQANPAVSVELVTERKMIDIVRAGYDAGIRTREAVPKDMVRVPLGGTIAFAICATPGYIKKHGAPATIRDLTDHACVTFRVPSGTDYHWELVQGRRDVAVPVTGPLLVDNIDLAVEACRSGIALALLPRWNVADDLAHGRLVQVLPEATPESPPLCLYYPSGRNPPPVLRAFAQHLRHRAGDQRK
ncbi:MAG: LysR family transcriptional regulator [Kofleriaceae bacterium]